MDLPITDTIRRAVSDALCEQWRAQILARLQAEHPRLVVVSMYARVRLPAQLRCQASRSYDPAWIDGLTRLVQQLRAHRRRRCWCSGRSRIRTQSVPICLSAPPR